MIFRRNRNNKAAEVLPEPASHDPFTPLRVTLANYTRERFVDRNRGRLLLIFSVLVLFYGMAFGIFSSFLMAGLLAPLAILGLMIIWLLPESDHSPAELMASFLLVFPFTSAWPDYLALQLPGMPWISLSRLIGFPMFAMFFICLSISKRFRSELKAVMQAVPVLWRAVAGLAIMSLLSVGVSKTPPETLNFLIVISLYLYCTFFIALHVFRVPGRALRVAYTLWGILVFNCLIGLWEGRLQALPWANHIPSLLQPHDPVILKILAFHARAASGIYRIQGRFTTSLGLAEFIGLLTPFVVHFLINGKTIQIRLAALASIPILFMAVIGTDSRLALISFFLSFIFYVIVWAVQRWTKNKGSIVGPAMVLAYPFLFAMIITASFTVHRIHDAVWGGGAAQASTLARQGQMQKGVPMVLSHPWGHGLGTGSATLQYANPAGEYSIDSYYLSLGLELGPIGLGVFIAIFISALFYCLIIMINSNDEELLLAAPLSITMCNFMLSKTIFSQVDNHSMVFMLLGLIGALYYRYKKEGKSSNISISSTTNPV